MTELDQIRDRLRREVSESRLPQSSAGGGALHFIAILTACAMFPLIFMGGLVTSHQAGMSVPDWPNSYGYNMFVFPPRLWIGGILYEHTHRLMGTVVGMLSICLVVAAYRSKWAGRRERVLAFALLTAVIAQGVLGGLRVVLVKLDLAIVHACAAQAVFCFAAFVALETSRWWQNAPRANRRRSDTPCDTGFQPVPAMQIAGAPEIQDNSDINPLARVENLCHEEGRSGGLKPAASPFRWGRSIVRMGVITIAAIYLQLIVGATMRHYQAGLAIPDLPLAYGKVLPPLTQSQLDAVNWVRVRDLNLDPVTMGQVWLHFGHRVGAILVLLLVVALAVNVFLRYAAEPRLLRPAGLLVVLLAAQVTLGVFTVLYRKPADVASAHVAVGALVLVTAFVLTARAIRLYYVRRSEIVSSAPVERTDASEATVERDSDFQPAIEM